MKPIKDKNGVITTIQCPNCKKYGLAIVGYVRCINCGKSPKEVWDKKAKVKD